MVKVLVATSAMQGTRYNDYNWCIEGELVLLLPVCRRDREDPDGGCGCGRGFAGMNSHRATTTAMVRTLAGFSRADYAEAVRSSLEAQGYNHHAAPRLTDYLLDVVEDLPDGVVVEKRLDDIQLRQVPM